MKVTLNCLIFLLLSCILACGGGGSSKGGSSTPMLTGKISYDSVPHKASGGLDFDNVKQSSIRGATVELLNATGTTILQSTTSDNNGHYSFVVNAQTSYIIRVKAELKKEETAPSWDFSIVDNTQEQALYSIQSSPQLVSDLPVTLNLNAPSGWNVSSYTTARMAAPFAILDAVYQAKEMIVQVDSGVIFPKLKINWSIENKAIQGDKSIGEITTSHYDQDEIYILGFAENDTDEFDTHVIIHEWGHYFEQNLSRTDSIGGEHSPNNKLDPRVALGEGFGNAFSGMVTNDPVYKDSFFGVLQNTGFTFSVEENPTTNRGWFSESSVQSLLYDIYDDNDDGADRLSLGFSPIYHALTKGEKITEAFTTVFSLMNQIKIESPTNAIAIDTLLLSQNIQVSDDFGSTELNNGGDAANLPLYQTLTINEGELEVCFNGINGNHNKLGNGRYIQFQVITAGRYRITASGRNIRDNAEISLFKKGELLFQGNTIGNESTSIELSSGVHVIDAYDASITDSPTSSSCNNVSVSSI